MFKFGKVLRDAALTATATAMLMSGSGDAAVFTGLVVDARGLGLRPAMSPVILTDEGVPIYGHRDLDYDLVTTKGMAGYTIDPTKAVRAGAHPLVVKAVAVTGNRPVITKADAEQVQAANADDHFLDNLSVVLVY